MAIAAVHPAQASDIPHIARIQRETWRVGYAGVLPAETLAAADAVDDDELTGAWEDARANGPARLFVATEGDWTVGFCAAGFAPDAELADAADTLPTDAGTVVLIGSLLVQPRWGRRGHGGRLLGTAVGVLREQGATRGVAWLLEGDQASRKFYARIGWHPDGTARTLDAAGQPIREIRITGDLDLTLKSDPEEVTTE